jgi:hypothetical protein
LLEPQISTSSSPGALFPANWLRPRFRFSAPGDLFEIRITSAVQARPLIAYTTTPSWTIPRDIWTNAALNNAGQPMTITVRAVQSQAPGTPIGVRGDIEVAPVNAGGSLVFWAVVSSSVGPESSKLYGSRRGRRHHQVLAPKTVPSPASSRKRARPAR